MIRNDDYFEIIKEQNKELAKFRPFKSAYEMKKEIEKLNSIIKEVREYIERNTEEKKSWLYGIPDYRVFKGDTKELLEILNKGDD